MRSKGLGNCGGKGKEGKEKAMNDMERKTVSCIKQRSHKE